MNPEEIIYLQIPFLEEFNDITDKYVNEVNCLYTCDDMLNAKYLTHYLITIKYKTLLDNNWTDDLKYQCEKTDKHPEYNLDITNFSELVKHERLRPLS